MSGLQVMSITYHFFPLASPHKKPSSCDPTLLPQRKKQEADAQKEEEFQAMYAEVLAGKRGQGVGRSVEECVEERDNFLLLSWYTQFCVNSTPFSRLYFSLFS